MSDPDWRWYRIPSAMTPLGFGFYRVVRNWPDGGRSTRTVWGYRRAERLMVKWSGHE